MNYERIGIEEPGEMEEHLDEDGSILDERNQHDDVEDPVTSAPEESVSNEIDGELLLEESSQVEIQSGDIEITDDDNAIPPVVQIRDLLSEFEMKVPVWGLTVFTVDGYILAHRLFYDSMPENIEMVVSSMSAGLITISEDFIRLVNASCMFRQVLVDADDENGHVQFSVLLKHVAENVMLTVIFPSSVQLGLLTFEVENLAKAINEIVGLWDVKLHEDTVT
ncbi:MAG: roadblock/LC7 domain-containing protein [Promethearchaeota archaeon]